MPKIPEVKQIKATGAQIVNAVLNDGAESGNSLARITSRVVPGDVATLRGIGELIVSDATRRNDFIETLMNRIGRVIFTNVNWVNDWAKFKKGRLEYGETTEDIFTEISRAFEYDPLVAESSQYRRVIPDTRVAFYRLNYRKFYKQTIQRASLRKAFLSEDGITNLASQVTSQMYTAAAHHERLTMRYLLFRVIAEGNVFVAEIPEPNAENSDAIVTILREYSNNFVTDLTNEYTMDSVHNATPRERQAIFLDNSLDAITSVSTMAKAFNLDNASLIGMLTLTKSFTFSEYDLNVLDKLFEKDPTYVRPTTEQINAMNNVHAVLCDEDFLMVYDNDEEFETERNAEGRYINQWLHVEKTFGVSPFVNVVAFASALGEVTGITITPATPTVTKTSRTQFTADVATTGLVNAKVVWSVTGQTDDYTGIDTAGVLYIGKRETATTLTVTATAQNDSTVTANTTVTVTQ